MVLYINGNYPHHSLHSELVCKLADLGNCITVFIPEKGKTLDGKYCNNYPNVNIIYCDCLKFTDKVFFRNKINRIVKKIEEYVDIKNVECILAGTLYSDGAVAYMLHKKYNIPFSVAIRHTDVTHHMKWRPYLNGFIKHLIKETSKIIFLTPSYEHCLTKFNPQREKYVLIPNAVNDFWFLNSPIRNRYLHNPVSLIYVGEITKNKNVCTTIMAIEEIKKRGIEIELHIVGAGEDEQRCRLIANRFGLSKQVFFHGWKTEKKEIKEYYEKSDIFIMLSFMETFGTVYVEALSQGLPILYTKGQGIDGYFTEGDVGYACNPMDINDIADKIQKIIDNYQDISKKCLIYSNEFTWQIVAQKYNEVICSMRE